MPGGDGTGPLGLGPGMGWARGFHGPGRGRGGYPPCWRRAGYRPATPASEVRWLKEEAEALRRELEAIERRLAETEPEDRKDHRGHQPRPCLGRTHGGAVR